MFDNLDDKDQMTELVIEQMNKTENNDEFMKKVVAKISGKAEE